MHTPHTHLRVDGVDGVRQTRVAVERITLKFVVKWIWGSDEERNDGPMCNEWGGWVCDIAKGTLACCFVARRNTLFTVGGVVHATHAGQTTAIRGKNTCHRFGGQEGMIWRR